MSELDPSSSHSVGPYREDSDSRMKVYESEIQDIEDRITELRLNVHGEAGYFTPFFVTLLVFGGVSQIAGYLAGLLLGGGFALWSALVPAMKRDRELSSLNSQKEELLEAVKELRGLDC